MSGQFYLAVLGDLVEHRATGTRAAIALRMAQLRFACPSPKHCRFNGQTVSISRFY
jgi:hypothetical protein